MKLRSPACSAALLLAIVVLSLPAIASAAEPWKRRVGQGFLELVSNYEVLASGRVRLSYLPAKCTNAGQARPCRELTLPRVMLECSSEVGPDLEPTLTVVDVFPEDSTAVLRDDRAAQLVGRDLSPGRTPRNVNAGRLRLSSIHLGSKGSELTFAVSRNYDAIVNVVRLGGVLTLPISSYVFPASAKGKADLQSFVSGCRRAVNSSIEEASVTAAKPARPPAFNRLAAMVSDTPIWGDEKHVLNYRPAECANSPASPECARIQLWCTSRQYGGLVVRNVSREDALAVLKDNRRVRLRGREPSEPSGSLEATPIPLEEITLEPAGVHLTFTMPSSRDEVFQIIELGGELTLPRSSYTFPAGDRDKVNLKAFLTACQNRD